MIWFLERGDRRLACELRRIEQSNRYEIALQSADGPLETLSCESPTDMIETFLRRHAQLQSEGWRPRVPPQLLI